MQERQVLRIALENASPNEAGAGITDSSQCFSCGRAGRQAQKALTSQNMLRYASFAFAMLRS
jgi:hypothetical protein